MSLTPLDIHNKEFGRTFRGYKEDDVDEFLDEVVKELEGYIRENIRLKDELEKFQANVDQYRKMENTLNSTLIVAQETAEEVRSAARREAELIVRESEEKAEKIITDARERAKQVAAENEHMRLQTQLLKSRLKTLLQSQLDLLDSGGQLQVDVDPAEPIE
jgi:cell division initiation protein